MDEKEERRLLRPIVNVSLKQLSISVQSKNYVKAVSEADSTILQLKQLQTSKLQARKLSNKENNPGALPKAAPTPMGHSQTDLVPTSSDAEAFTTYVISSYLNKGISLANTLEMDKVQVVCSCIEHVVCWISHLKRFLVNPSDTSLTAKYNDYCKSVFQILRTSSLKLLSIAIQSRNNTSSVRSTVNWLIKMCSAMTIGFESFIDHSLFSIYFDMIYTIGTHFEKASLFDDSCFFFEAILPSLEKLETSHPGLPLREHLLIYYLFLVHGYLNFTLEQRILHKHLSKVLSHTQKLVNLCKNEAIAYPSLAKQILLLSSIRQFLTKNFLPPPTLSSPPPNPLDPPILDLIQPLLPALSDKVHLYSNTKTKNDQDIAYLPLTPPLIQLQWQSYITCALIAYVKNGTLNDIFTHLRTAAAIARSINDKKGKGSDIEIVCQVMYNFGVKWQAEKRWDEGASAAKCAMDVYSDSGEDQAEDILFKCEKLWTHCKGETKTKSNISEAKTAKNNVTSETKEIIKTVESVPKEKRVSELDDIIESFSLCLKKTKIFKLDKYLPLIKRFVHKKLVAIHNGNNNAGSYYLYHFLRRCTMENSIKGQIVEHELRYYEEYIQNKYEEMHNQQLVTMANHLLEIYQETSVDRARSLIFKSKFLRFMEIDKAFCCIKEAIEMIKTLMSTMNDLFLVDILATAYAWLGLISREKLQGNYDIKSKWIHYFNKSIVYWQQLFTKITSPSPDKQCFIYNNNDTLFLIEQLADLFELLHENELSISVLKLEIEMYEKILKNEEDSVYKLLILHARIGSIYYQLGYCELGSTHFGIANKMIEDKNLAFFPKALDKKSVENNYNLYWMLVSGLYFYESGKIESSSPLKSTLKKLQEDYLMSKKHTLSDCLLVAQFRFLVSNLYLKEGKMDKSLVNSLESISLILSAVPKEASYLVNEEPKKSKLSSTQYSLINSLHKTLLHTATLYHLLGSTREAQYYYKKILHLSQQIYAKIPEIKATLSLAELYYREGKFEQSDRVLGDIAAEGLGERLMLEKEVKSGDGFWRRGRIEEATKRFIGAHKILEMLKELGVEKVNRTLRAKDIEWTPRELKIVRKFEEKVEKRKKDSHVLEREDIRLALKNGLIQLEKGNLDESQKLLTEIYLKLQEVEKFSKFIGFSNDAQFYSSVVDKMIIIYHLGRVYLRKAVELAEADSIDLLNMIWNEPEHYLKIQKKNTPKWVSLYDKAKKYLEQSMILSMQSGLSPTITREICQDLALATGNISSGRFDSCSLINGSIGISFYHKYMSNISKKITQLEKTKLRESREDVMEECVSSKLEDLDLNKNVNDDDPFDLDDTSVEEKLSKLQDIHTVFSKSCTELYEEPKLPQSFSSCVPADWTVISIVLTSDQQNLLVTRISGTHPPLAVRIPLLLRKKVKDSEKMVERNEYQEMRKVFDLLIANSTEQLLAKDTKKIDRAQWWDTRFEMDFQLKKVLSDMENKWFGDWKSILLGAHKDQKVRKEMEEEFSSILKRIEKKLKISLSTDKIELFRVCFYGCGHSTDAEMIRFLRRTLEWENRKSEIENERREALLKILEIFRESYLRIMQLHGEPQQDGIETQQSSPYGLSKKSAPPHSSKAKSDINSLEKKCLKYGKIEVYSPVILILDKHLHQIPFESFPILRNMSVTRMPSLIFTKARLELNSTLKCKPDVSLKRAYYIVNPDGSLEKTEQCVLPILKKLGLNRGLVGSTPKSSVSEVFLSALQKEILIYCGHNSGEQYVKREDIQKLDHCAVSLLMGCSSLSLEGSIDSDFEPEGTPSNYFLANCTATAGNLWVVTDKDLDTVTCSLLSDWADHSNKWSLLDCVPLAREKCKLPYLNGAALIHYGFPMYCKKE